MSLKEQINQDFLNAYKNKDEAKSSLLRLLKSSIQNAEIAKKGELSDEEIFKLLQKEIKQRQEAIVEYKKGGREDLVNKDQAEIDLLKAYLPAELSDSELEQIVNEAIKNTGASGQTDFGKVMGATMPKIAGKASGDRVSQMVKSKLS